jgi:hypothetical protein
MESFSHKLQHYAYVSSTKVLAFLPKYNTANRDVHISIAFQPKYNTPKRDVRISIAFQPKYNTPKRYVRSILTTEIQHT